MPQNQDKVLNKFHFFWFVALKSFFFMLLFLRSCYFCRIVVTQVVASETKKRAFFVRQRATYRIAQHQSYNHGSKKQNDGQDGPHPEKDATIVCTTHPHLCARFLASALDACTLPDGAGNSPVCHWCGVRLCARR